jgi:calcium-dependent protein kinase
MGSCYVNESTVNVVNLKGVKKITIKRKTTDIHNLAALRKSKLSGRSSIYVVNNEEITKAYNFDSQIGAGYYGTVKIAIPKNDPNKRYAVKSIDKTKLSPAKIEKLSREIEILSALDHPNILKYYETYNDDQFFHIVTEYCSGGELFERIIKKKNYTEAEAANVIFKIASAITHCHSLNIVHRDLKPENILYENQTEMSDIKIIDFGLSRKYKSELDELHSIVGSPYYVAPEVLEGAYDAKCDIWSIGVMMYVLLSGTPPFYSENKVELYYKIRNEQPSFNLKIFQSISKEAIDLMNEMLNKNSKKRPNAIKLLEHKWFKIHLSGEFSYRKIDREILHNLRSFQQPRQLIRSFLKFIVKELKPDQIENLKKAFTILDQNKTGFIDIDQLKSAFDTCNININNDELKIISSNFSTKKGNEKINYSTFITAALDKKHLLNKDLMWDIFKHLDSDNSGYITINDIEIALKRTGRIKTIDQIQEMFKEAGLSVDAKITFNDFLALLEREL